MQSRSFEREEDAKRAEQRSIWRRRGYQPTPDVVARWREVMAARASIQGAIERQKIRSKWSRYLELTEQVFSTFRILQKTYHNDAYAACVGIRDDVSDTRC